MVTEPTQDHWLNGVAAWVYDFEQAQLGYARSTTLGKPMTKLAAPCGWRLVFLITDRNDLEETLASEVNSFHKQAGRGVKRSPPFKGDV